MADSLPLAVVVVGGAGCLGRPLVRRWAAKIHSASNSHGNNECAKMSKGPKVVSLDKRPNPEADVNILVDLLDTQAVEEQLFGSFNVQAMIVAVKPPLVGPSYQAFMELNAAAVCELVQSAERHNVGQFVYASSIACSNHWAPHVNSKENDPEANPSLTELHSAYDLSKALAERFVLKHHSETGTRTASIRMGGLYGEDDDPYWFRRIPLGISFDVGGDPKVPLIDSNYVENVAEAMLRVADRLASDASVGGRFYYYTHGDRPASQQEISWQLAKQEGRALSPTSYFSTGSMWGMAWVNQTFDNTLFKSTFGYSHTYTVEEAAEEIHKAAVQRKLATSGTKWWHAFFCTFSLAFRGLRNKKD